MNRARRLSLTMALLVGLTPAIPVTANATGLMDAISSGTPSVDLRYRYETVDQTGIADTAQASTLRTRLGYTTAPFNGLKAMVEFESIVTVDGDEYSKPGRPVVADPDGTELNRAALIYGADGVTATLGRQRIILDNGRFIGNVGWRQNEQTYDAARIDIAPTEALSSTYAYVANVNGIKFTDADHDTHLLNLGYQFASAGKLSAYGYLLNNDDAPASGSQTFGLRYKGSYQLGAVKLGVTAEGASQSEYANSGIGDSSYLFGELAGTTSGVTAKVGYELLGGDGVDEFATPLATGHAFNGWADKFLGGTGVAKSGIADLILTLTGKVAGVKLLGVYHDFSADEGSADLGTELDLLVTTKIGAHTVGVKYASYSADTHASDTDKLWLFAQTQF
jgi:hypothetical protein